jgi:iron complex transport system ATP-binding protein
VLGPNGAGKTTVLHTATGELTPTSGTVTVLGRELGAPGTRDPRPRMGLIEATPRSFALQMSTLSVVLRGVAGSVAGQGAKVEPRHVDRADGLLERFGCAHLRDRPFADCSRGERQRILFARALMREPAILLLDEPATGLDLPGREALLVAMTTLAAEEDQLATVTVTHHVEEMAPSTTHALLLRDGTVVASGTVEDTMTSELISACFGVSIALSREDNRWAARTPPGW